jgi:hypothetical protein
VSEQKKTPVWLQMTAAAAGFIAFILALSGMISAMTWADYLIADARDAKACEASWDEDYHPRYRFGECSVLVGDRRMPADSYSVYDSGARD